MTHITSITLTPPEQEVVSHLSHSYQISVSAVMRVAIQALRENHDAYTHQLIEQQSERVKKQRSMRKHKPRL